MVYPELGSDAITHYENAVQSRSLACWQEGNRLPMLPLDDPRWQTYNGAYRLKYDASRPLVQLFAGEPPVAIWRELWQELHHQGDVDAASYAAVPHLLAYARSSTALDWNVFALISTIELSRPANPPPPPELVDAYFQAIQGLPVVVGAHSQQHWSPELTQSIVSCLALARGQRLLARAYLEFSLQEAKSWLQEFGVDIVDELP